MKATEHHHHRTVSRFCCFASAASTSDLSHSFRRKPSPDSSMDCASQQLAKSVVIGTFFGPRQGRVSFCIQQSRLNSKPFLLLDLSIPTCLLAEKMRSGLSRIALECGSASASARTLHSAPLWTVYCNGHKAGFATRRRPDDRDFKFLKAMESTSTGAGVFQPLVPHSGEPEILYVRASFERVVGSPDSESYHLINPQCSPGQELSVFLLRSGH